MFAEDTYDGAFATEVFVTGYLCTYSGAADAKCAPFTMAFQRIDDPVTPHRVGFSRPGESDCCEGPWFSARNGAFVLTYAGPTGS